MEATLQGVEQEEGMVLSKHYPVDKVTETLDKIRMLASDYDMGSVELEKYPNAMNEIICAFEKCIEWTG